MIFYSEIKNGVETIYRKDDMDKFISTCKDGKYIHEIKRYSENRSLEQNRLMWAYTTIIANELGYEKETMHEIIKYKFLKREKVNEDGGEVLEYLKSTTKLTKPEFAEFIKQLQIWSAQTFNVILPDPETQLKII